MTSIDGGRFLLSLRSGGQSPMASSTHRLDFYSHSSLSLPLGLSLSLSLSLQAPPDAKVGRPPGARHPNHEAEPASISGRSVPGGHDPAPWPRTIRSHSPASSPSSSALPSPSTSTTPWTNGSVPALLLGQ